MDCTVRIVGFAVGLFVFAFATHWLCWRVCLPRRQTLALLLIFLGAFPAAVGLYFLAPHLPLSWPHSVWEWLHVAEFHTAMALSYIVLYSMLEENSPSLTIIGFVAEAGSAGRTPDEVFGLINDDLILRSRLHAMLRDGLVRQTADAYRLTPKGQAWVRVFSVFRRLLSRAKGG